MDKELMPVYCSVDFLKTWFEKWKGPAVLEGVQDRLYSLIYWNANLILDTTKDELIQEFKDHPYFLRLVNHVNQGICKVAIAKGVFQALQVTTEQNSVKHDIFLGGLDEDFICYLRAKQGAIAISSCDESEEVQQYLQSGEEFINQDISRWSDVIPKELPSNSLIICDRYLLKSQRNWRPNLIKILELILPQTLDCTFDILILAMFPSNKAEAIHIARQLHHTIKQIRPEMSMNVCIANSNIHSRWIISNYFYLVSTHSFDFFYENGGLKHSKKDDSVVLGFFSDDNKKFRIASKKLESVSSVLSRAIKQNDFYGEPKNRLVPLD